MDIAGQLGDRFLSLGANCEFALVQKHWGVEPLNLMNFVQIPAARLARFLREGLPRLATSDLPMGLLQKPVAGKGHEYRSWFDDYQMEIHTGIFTHRRDEAFVLQVEKTRLPRLAQKLLRDLASGQKIFVRGEVEASTEEHIRSAARELKRLGPAQLLWVTPASEADRVGHVSRLTDNLLHGPIDTLTADMINFSYAGWRMVCLRGLAQARRRRRFSRGAQTLLEAPATAVNYARSAPVEGT